MSQYSVKQQYFRIGYLAICFMIMFSSFGSLQNIVSKLYDQYNYQQLGQYSIITIYLTFVISTTFSSFIIKKLGYKTVLFFSSLGYAIFQSTGFLIVTKNQVPKGIVTFSVLIGSMVCGASASTLWVSQGSYISLVASPDRRSQIAGLFWAIKMSSQIFGSLITTFVLGKISNLVYFFTLTFLGCKCFFIIVLSAIMFLFLPNVNTNSRSLTQQKPRQLKEQIKKIWQIIKNTKYINLLVYFLFSGLITAFYAGFLYKIISVCFMQQVGESIDIYAQRVSYKTGFVFISLGISQVLMGVWMLIYSQRFCKFKFARFCPLIVILAGVFSFLAYQSQSYPLCFLCAILWGSSENMIQTNCNALISQIFPNNIEAFSVFRIFNSLGCCLVLLIQIILIQKPSAFIIIIIVISVIVAKCVYSLINLNQNKDQTPVQLVEVQAEIN